MKEIVVTFGTAHNYCINGRQVGYANPALIKAETFQDCNDKVRELFGTKYCTWYTKEHWDNDPNLRSYSHGLVEIDVREDLNTKSIEESIVEEARASWPGEAGDQRADRVAHFLTELDMTYRPLLPEGTNMLEAFEAHRKYTGMKVMDFYTYEVVLHPFDIDHIFDSTKDFPDNYWPNQFLCPSCKNISSKPYVCDSGVKVNGKSCTAEAMDPKLKNKLTTVLNLEKFATHPVVSRMFGLIRKDIDA